MFTVIDIETTGLSKHQHKITEIAAVKFHNRKVVDSFQTLINPQVRIPSFITRLTGINNAMVEHSPTIRQVLPSFRDFLADDVFVAHNATFDFGFIEHNTWQHHRIKMQNKTLCTKKLANRLLPELPRKRLQDLCAHFDVENVQAHRALADVHATVGVLDNMLNILHDKGIKEVNQVLKFEKSSVAKCRSFTP